VQIFWTDKGRCSLARPSDIPVAVTERLEPFRNPSQDVTTIEEVS
jgi:hypothetical protein